MINVQKANGDIVQVGWRSLLDQLQDDDSFMDVVRAVSTGDPCEVALRDGLATVQLADTHTSPRMLPVIQRAAYTVHGHMTFGLPVRIHCSACSAEDAAEAVRGAVLGDRGLPPGFRIEVNQEEISALFNSLEIGSMTSIEDLKIRVVHLAMPTELPLLSHPYREHRP